MIELHEGQQWPFGLARPPRADLGEGVALGDMGAFGISQLRGCNSVLILRSMVKPGTCPECFTQLIRRVMRGSGTPELAYRTSMKLEPFALQIGHASGGVPNSILPQTGQR